MSVRENPLGIDATRDEDVIGSLPKDFPEYNAEIPATETTGHDLVAKQSK